MKLVWLSTGDELEFTPTSHTLCEYFVTELKQRQLSCIDNKIDVDYADKLLGLVADINHVLAKTQSSNTFDISDPYDQRCLNKLHSDWVKIHLNQPNFVNLLQLIDSELVTKFRAINKTLHAIEKMFIQHWAGIEDDMVIRFERDFSSLLTFDTTNVLIAYNNLGRSTFNKWINFDNDIGHEDTNDYQTLPVELRLSLSRTEIQEPPSNYVEWCKQQGLKTVPGRTISFGNFVDLEKNLTDYRKVMIRNSHNQMTLTF